MKIKTENIKVKTMPRVEFNLTESRYLAAIAIVNGHASGFEFPGVPAYTASEAQDIVAGLFSDGLVYEISYEHTGNGMVNTVFTWYMNPGHMRIFKTVFYPMGKPSVQIGANVYQVFEKGEGLCFSDSWSVDALRSLGFEDTEDTEDEDHE